MKAKKNVSNSASFQPVKGYGSDEVEFAAKKLWLSLIFGAGLFLPSTPPHAQEGQETGNPSIQPPGSTGQAGNEGIKAPDVTQGAGDVLAPPTGLRVIQGEEETPPGPAPPDSENINKGTAGPGGDNMMRDAIPGGSGLKRE